MANSLQTLFYRLATAQNQHQLRLRFMDTGGECFGVQRWGIYLFNPQSQAIAVDVQGVPDSFVERYEQVGRAIDPVLRYVLEYHAPAHEQLVLGPEGWEQCALYQHCCAYYDHKHIMTGPIVGKGQLIGTVHFARIGNAAAFDCHDLVNLSAVCAHLSACLAALAIPQGYRTRSNPLTASLTFRELQIASLVAKGLTNAEIGAELWITQNSVKQALKRMFRKLNVSSRTEMVTQLQGMTD